MDQARRGRITPFLPEHVARAGTEKEIRTTLHKDGTSDLSDVVSALWKLMEKSAS